MAVLDTCVGFLVVVIYCFWSMWVYEVGARAIKVMVRQFGIGFYGFKSMLIAWRNKKPALFQEKAKSPTPKVRGCLIF